MLLRLARRNAYDGVEEFWIVIRETALHTTETSYEEQHQKNAKAPGILSNPFRSCSSTSQLASPDGRRRRILLSKTLAWGMLLSLAWMQCKNGVSLR